MTTLETKEETLCLICGKRPREVFGPYRTLEDSPICRHCADPVRGCQVRGLCWFLWTMVLVLMLILAALVIAEGCS